MAARRIQTWLKRKRATSDRVQLGSIIRSHRRSNPYQIQPSSGRSVTFWRKVEINLGINQLLGFGIGGNSLNWGFSLGYVYGYLNGIFTYAPTVPNASEFQALFDYYMIKSVKMQMFFSKNSADLVNTGTGMPLLLVANDFDDIVESMTLSAMLQRVGVRHVQFDSNNVNGINHYIKPKCTGVVVSTDASTGITSNSPSGIPFGSTWLDTAQSNIVHSGIKLFYDNQGLSSNTNLGQITFVFDVEFVFKGYR